MRDYQQEIDSHPHRIEDTTLYPDHRQLCLTGHPLMKKVLHKEHWEVLMLRDA